jgi:hypothetical protein
VEKTSRKAGDTVASGAEVFFTFQISKINPTGEIHLKSVKVSEVITQFQIKLHQFEDERFRAKIFLNRIPASEHFTVLCYCVMNFEPAW